MLSLPFTLALAFSLAFAGEPLEDSAELPYWPASEPTPLALGCAVLPVDFGSGISLGKVSERQVWQWLVATVGRGFTGV